METYNMSLDIKKNIEKILEKMRYQPKDGESAPQISKKIGLTYSEVTMEKGRPKKDKDGNIEYHQVPLKLIQLLSCIDDDEYIYLGTTNGSGWLWIDTCANMKEILMPMSIKLHDEKDNAIYNKEQDVISFYEDEYQLKKEYIGWFIKKYKIDVSDIDFTKDSNKAVSSKSKRKKKDNIFEVEEEDEDTDNKEETKKKEESSFIRTPIQMKLYEKSKLYSGLAKTCSYMSTWVDLPSRQVMGGYMHKLVEPYGLSIIIKGNETGYGAWNIEDLKGKKKDIMRYGY